MHESRPSSEPARAAGPVTAFARGISAATRRLPLAGAMWLFNLLMAVPLAAFFRSIVDDPLGRAGASDPARTTYLFVSDLTRAESTALEALGVAAGVAGIVYMAGSALVAAGAIESLAFGSGGFRLRAFFGGVARFGGRFLRLFGLVLAATFCVLFVMNGPVAALAERATDQSSDEWPALAATLLRYGVTFMLLAAIMLVADYAKVRMVVEDAPSAFAEAVRAAAFVLSRPAAIGAFVLCELVSLATLGVTLALGRADRPSTPVGMLLLLAATQLVMLARMWVRIAFWSTTLEVVRGVSR